MASKWYPYIFEIIVQSSFMCSKSIVQVTEKKTFLKNHFILRRFFLTFPLAQNFLLRSITLEAGRRARPGHVNVVDEQPAGRRVRWDLPGPPDAGGGSVYKAQLLQR